MKRKHLAAFSCTLALPVGVLAGLGFGQPIGLGAELAVLGAVLACVVSIMLVRRTPYGDLP